MKQDKPESEQQSLKTKRSFKKALVEKIKVELNFKKEKPRKRIIFFGALLAVFVWLFWGVPIPTNISQLQPVSTRIFDRKGKLIYEIYTDKRSTPIKLTEIPENIRDATIAVEDKDFYKHHGISFTGIGRALYKIVFQRKLEGGSTITQQLVKNSLLSPERTVQRKIREFFLTMVVETIYSKDQILEYYLNQIPYGGTAYGIEAASELYFDKATKDLSLAESAFLVGLPAAPSRYSPFGSHPELAKSRQETVLRRMVEDGYINEEDAQKALAEELVFAKSENPTSTHFALWIKEQLAEKYGDKIVEQGGLRVTTTLDADLQKFAQEEVAREIAKLTKQKVGNGAALITRPASGEILAMVGSKDYFATDEDGKVNVIFAKRQPGSSIKPINYALALKDGKITPATAFADIPTCFSVTGQQSYCPKNYDNTFHGLVQTRFALGNSYNIPAVKTLALNEVPTFVDFAKAMGLTTLTDPQNYGLSLTLGGGEIRPADMAVAFGVFANEGVKQPLVSILKVEDYKGRVLEETKLQEKDGDKILEPGVTFLISHILQDNNARSAAFGERSFLNVSGHPEVSVKTGTTNDRRDNWTIGYTAHALALVWVGNNDNSPMGGAVSGVSGASPIWNKIIKNTLDKAEDGYYNSNDEGHAWPKQPSDVVGASICATTGLMPTGGQDNPGCPTRFEYFLEGTLPKPNEEVRMDINLYKDTHAQAKADAPPEQVETQNHPVYIDPTGAIYCLDCPMASDSANIRYPLGL